MSRLDRVKLPEDPLFDELLAKMDDGGADAWVNLPVATVSKYACYKLLEALEELDQVMNKADNAVPIQKLLDDRILRLFTLLNEPVEHEL
jgi:hypothetical protein